ncbi:peptidoglycan DD-metalloendopeptidase family protein [Paenibacillus yanchengensis]|uniref:Peptidoglycan DD-metalloendopeptidase family protein n=1 Tax=Paenibacillus yanchengensis TaxID=2035833 RepID=A0ABW4YN60_9BACL
MNEQNKNKSNQRPEEAPKNRDGATSAVNSSSGWKKLFAKRWISPALFMAAAAIIVTLMWIYQGTDPSKEASVPSDVTEVTQEGEVAEEQPVVGEDTAPAPEDLMVEGEMMQWPVQDMMALQVDTPFYDVEASASEKEAALMQVGSTYLPHMGIDLAHPSGETFEVVAAMSGNVTYVNAHPTNGSIIEIDHGNGLVTVYQSLSDVQVAEGTEVKQGTIIAKAGRNELESDLGVHLHFEARLNGDNINPSAYIKS